MAPYRHFANRQALLEELARREFARIAADPAISWDGDPDRVDPALASHLDLALGQPRLYAFLFTEPRDGARRYPGDMRAGLSPTLNTLIDGLRAARRRGDLVVTDEWETAMIIAAQLHGLVQLRHGGRVDLDEDGFRQLCARAVGVILAGLRP
jgi:AcrR family transcriptional regulator